MQKCPNVNVESAFRTQRKAWTNVSGISFLYYSPSAPSSLSRVACENNLICWFAFNFLLQKPAPKLTNQWMNEASRKFPERKQQKLLLKTDYDGFGWKSFVKFRKDFPPFLFRCDSRWTFIIVSRFHRVNWYKFSSSWQKSRKVLTCVKWHDFFAERVNVYFRSTFASHKKLFNSSGKCQNMNSLPRSLRWGAHTMEKVLCCLIFFSLRNKYWNLKWKKREHEKIYNGWGCRWVV